MQSTLFRLGRVPAFHQTDNSTAATHDLRTGTRGFNEESRAMTDHFGMTPRQGRIPESRYQPDHHRDVRDGRRTYERPPGATNALPCCQARNRVS
jgi:hypothetical protein